MTSIELDREVEANNPDAKFYDKSESTFEELKEMLEGAGYQVKKKTAATKQAIENYSKTHPWEAIVISALAGATLSLLLRK